ncbi:MAG: DUF192 domain-containing protein [Dehalococcoidales bacterium]|nr:DUF192 domain-containing protein [Dehalococcoidales bacterium]
MPGQATVIILDKQWQCAVANMPQELTGGLGGVESILPGTGMLFDLGFEQTIHVTTVPMLFPLDIVFLSEDLTIIEVYRNVEPGYLVTSTQLARYFIEVNAGELDGIAPGDTASVDFLPFEEIPVAPDWLSMMFILAGFLLLGTLTVSIARDFTGKAFEEPGEKPAFLPQVSSRKSTDSYELETDRTGNIILTRSDDPKKDVFLQFESDRTLVYDLLKKAEKKDMDAGWKVKIKRSDPRASILDELWGSSAQPQRLPSTAKKPTRHDVTVEAWQERDRLGIWLTDNRTGKTIAEWWDEDAREMFEQGFFKPGVPQRTTEKPSRAFVDSVLDYAESVGLLAGGKNVAQTGTCYADAWRFLIKEEEGTLIHGTVFSGGRRMGHAWVETATGWIWEPQTGRYFTLLGFRDAFAPDKESRYTAEQAAIMAARAKHLGPWTKEERQRYLKEKYPAIIPEGTRSLKSKDKLEFLPDSPEYLAYTIDDIGYRDRIDSAFLGAIARARGKRLWQ